MMAQINYKLYKITNSIDDKIYIGSTKLNPLRKRMDGHRSAFKKGIDWTIYRHMRLHGIDNFKIEHIRDIVANKTTARIQEQIVIWSIPAELRLNTHRAHIPNSYYRGNIDGKRANRRAFYNRKTQDPVWMEQERVRNKEKMRVKRQLARVAVRD